MPMHEVLRAIDEAEYERRSRPAESFESAVNINSIWLVEEVVDARNRGSIDDLKNLGSASFIWSVLGEKSADRISGHAAFRLAVKSVVELSRQQG